MAAFSKKAGLNVRYVRCSREEFLAGLGGGVAAHDILGNLEYLAGEQYLPMTMCFQNLSNSSAEYQSFGGEAVTATNDVLLGYPMSPFEDWVESSYVGGAPILLTYFISKTCSCYQPAAQLEILENSRMRSTHA